jgi:hypothetical protein
MYRADSLTGMFSALLDRQILTSSITMRLESVDGDAPLTDYAETALPGEDWSWC